MSMNQQARKVLRQSSSAEGGERLAGGAGAGGGFWGAIDINPKPRGGGNGKRKDGFCSFDHASCGASCTSPPRRQSPWLCSPAGEAAGAFHAEGLRPVLTVALTGTFDRICPRQAPTFTPPSFIPSPGVGLPCRPCCARLAHLDVAQAGQLSL